MRARSLHVARRAGVVAAAMLVTLGSALVGLATPAAAAKVQGQLVLESQTPAFVANQSGITLGLDVSSALPASALSIEVTLYSMVQARYTLHETLSGSLPNLLTPLGNPGVIPLDLKSLGWVSGRTVAVRLPVLAPDLPGDATSKADAGTNGVILSVENCLPPDCGGVYPLQVSLLAQGVTPVASFTTDVILTPPSEVAGTHPLRFSWVLPLGASPAIAPSGAPEVDITDIDEIETLNTVLGEAPNASVSLDVFPQFVESLDELNGPVAQAALVALRTLTGSGGQADVLPSTFAPVDPDALVSSHLSSDVTAQLARSRQILSPSLEFEAHEFAAERPIGSAALALLEHAGITRLIVPSSGAQPLNSTFSQWTPTTPFIIPRSGVEAIASDPGLEQDLASKASPALSAQQMLADLSIVYFDNTGAEQGLAVESPIGSTPSEAFEKALLTGLSESSVVRAVTLAGIFDNVTPGSSPTSPDQRSLRSPNTPPGAIIPIDAIRTARQSLAALTSMLPATRPSRSRPPLSDLILMAEQAGATLPQRLSYLDTIDRQAGSLAGLVSLPYSRTITMTSLRAKIPISIVSSARVPLLAELTAASPDLGFPKGHTWFVKLYPRTNVVEIQLTARTTGNFPLQLALTTRTGYLVSSGTMYIRSTAISGVAVALSIGAAAFLVIWWSRSILTKRRKRHKLRGAELAASAVVGGDDAAGAGGA